jgi:uncharacterized cupin superfamily protein
MKKIDIDAIPLRRGSRYPAPFSGPVEARERRALGDAGGLSQFGVNLLNLPPGTWSSQRHWHSDEDEFVWILEGELTLITEGGEEILRAGDCAAFKAGDADGHHLVNRSDKPARALEIGTRDPDRDRTVYPDVDMVAEPSEPVFRRRDGTPYET